MLALACALLAAAAFAASSAFQHRGASTTASTPGAGWLARVVRQPLWLLGLVAGGAGLLLQGVALATGSLVLVQPLLVSGLLLALPLSLLLEHRRASPGEWGWAAAVVAGLATFLVAARPGAGTALPDETSLALVSGACGVLAAAAALVGATAWRRHRAALLGLAGGTAFGVTSALLKQVTGVLARHPGALPLDWALYALVAAGTSGVVATQWSYRSGSLTASQPAITVAEPVAAVVLGATAYGEHLSASPLAVIGQLVGALVLVVGVVRLSAATAAPAAAPAPHDSRRRPRRTAGPASPAAPDDGEGSGPAAPRVLVVTGSVGAGHDGAAHELARRLRARGVEVDVRDYLHALLPGAAPALREGYALSVGRVPAVFEWLFTAIERRPLVRTAVWGLCRTGDRRVLSWTRRHAYAAVVSTYPLASQSLGHLRATGRLGAPVVTYLTDPAAHRCWVHPGVDHHWTVTGATALQGRRDYGVAMTAAGPLVPERFAASAAAHGAGHGPAREPSQEPREPSQEPREPSQERDRELRRELGLAPDRPVALVVSGSLGLGDVEHGVTRVLDAGLAVLVLCGRNEPLRRRLAVLPGVVALGWRDDVPDLMRLADVLVHNAGGMSFTEALVSGLPAVSYRCIPGHGRANAAVLEAAGLATWAHTDDELAGALHRAVARGRSPLAPLDPAEQLLALLAPVAVPAVADPARVVDVVRPRRRAAREASGASAAW